MGVFYRPPNSDAFYNQLIENSIHMAIDTNIDNIVITGDFNYNMYNPNTSRNITKMCQELSLNQVINDATHFTENSSSLIDLFLVNDKDNVVISGVGDPFLLQSTRYHCPIYCLLKFIKPKQKNI